MDAETGRILRVGSPGILAFRIRRLLPWKPKGPSEGLVNSKIPQCGQEVLGDVARISPAAVQGENVDPAPACLLKGSFPQSFRIAEPGEDEVKRLEEPGQRIRTGEGFLKCGGQGQDLLGTHLVHDASLLEEGEPRGISNQLDEA
jgi:hypothetical protein